MAFSPGMIANLQLWLDAADINGNGDGNAGLTSGSSRVRSWKDKSGNARHATATLGPTYQAAGLRGLPALRFAGVANEGLCTPAFMDNTCNCDGTHGPLNSAGKTGFTAIIVGQINAVSTWETLIHYAWQIVYFNNVGGLQISLPTGLVGLLPIANAVTGVLPSTAAVVLTLTHTGDGTHLTVSMRANGSPCYNPAAYAGASLGNSGLPVTIGYKNGGSDYLTGALAAVLIFNRALEAAEAAAVERYYCGYSTIPNLVVCDGNSLTFGAGATRGTSDYPALLTNLLNPTMPPMPWSGNQALSGPSPWFVANTGILGETCGPVGGASDGGMIAQAPTRIDPVYGGAWRNCICVAWEVRNDIVAYATVNPTWSADQLAVQALANLRTYCLARRAAGWRVITLPTVPMTLGAIWTATMEAARLLADQMLLEVWPGFADAVPLAMWADARIQFDARSATWPNTYWSSDNTHLNAAGNQIIAGYVYQAIANLLAVGDNLSPGQVLAGTGYKGQLATGALDLPLPGDVRKAVVYGAGTQTGVLAAGTRTGLLL